MGRRCRVPMCKSGYYKSSENISLFSVPRNCLSEWNRVIPRKDRPLTIKDSVFERHFNASEIIREVKTDCYNIMSSQMIDFLLSCEEGNNSNEYVELLLILLLIIFCLALPKIKRFSLETKFLYVYF